MDVTRSTSWLAVALLASHGACSKTSMTTGRDAGRDRPVDDTRSVPAPETASPDATNAIADAPADAASVGGLDLGSPELAPGYSGVPAAFRFDNETDQTVYVQFDAPVGCRTRTASGWQDCSFFGLGCLFRCERLTPGQSCCVFCESPIPAVYAIAPRSSRYVPWGGSIFAKSAAACSECECQQETRVASGDFEASARVFGDYACAASPCAVGTDGVIQNASGRGGAITLTVPFAVPHPDLDVVFSITGIPGKDAGTTPDSRATDAAAVTLDELAGRTFKIAAADSFPDASVPGAAGCVPSAPSARYSLVFSADGTKVKISRTDPVQEVDLNGTLDRQSESQIVYRLDAFAGGELIIKPGHVAQLVIFGSGRPVLSCIEAPMKP
jgi:hypothetical protein